MSRKLGNPTICLAGHGESLAFARCRTICCVGPAAGIVTYHRLDILKWYKYNKLAWNSYVLYHAGVYVQISVGSSKRLLTYKETGFIDKLIRFHREHPLTHCPLVIYICMCASDLVQHLFRLWLVDVKPLLEVGLAYFQLDSRRTNLKYCLLNVQILFKWQWVKRIPFRVPFVIDITLITRVFWTGTF